ncbi:PDZ domain-containing protein, partial [Patescibacteria group bacterium]|nr:PDZ domain-containing protein [Patescibacteria group bacterium]
LKNFNETGQFNRPFLGISYIMIDRRTAMLKNLPEGAYVQDVVPNSSADKAGIQADDIITKIDGEKINDQNGLATIISKKKVGDTITVTLDRNDKSMDLKVVLEAAQE